jgi:hypothetical protein
MSMINETYASKAEEMRHEAGESPAMKRMEMGVKTPMPKNEPFKTPATKHESAQTPHL